MLFYKSPQEITKIQKLINLQEGNSIADIGTGKGFYVLGFSKIVGSSGKVFATEFNNNLLSSLASTIKNKQITNITLLQSSSNNCNLPENSADYIFLRGVYHHLSNPDEFNISLYKALKPNGSLIIVDFAPKFLLTLFSPVKNVPINREGHGIKKEILIDELSKANFKLKQEIPNWVWGRYCLILTK